jgi:ABC-type Mn2+/Zn2+ transport system permease subunit
MVGVYLTSSPWWYFQFAIGIFIWLSLFIYRKSWKRKNEISEQLFFGFLSLGVNLLSDTVAIFTDLWHYSGGDWPIVLWPLMFLAGVSAFQLFKFIDERWFK